VLFHYGAMPAVATPAPGSTVPRYVGAAACTVCHAAQAAAWQGSHHAAAMQPATAQSVLGRFDGSRFSDNGITSTFLRKGEGYYVHTDGPDGQLADFEVKYTFGVYPLQQYLVPFPDGRLQALPFAWDARPQQQGGQRWFHLYGGQGIDHRDPLHWTRLNQNWNFMCADCHSTHLQRRYDAAGDRYDSRWSDLAVGCESCHGPGSAHLAWARHPGGAEDAGKGLAIDLGERHGAQWRLDPASGNSSRSPALDSHREVETCAVCHARRRSIATESGPTGRLLDTHDPALLEEGMYFPDGQQQDEVYIYSSFLQSKMYAKGVSCSDCHEPHSLKLRAEGNALCAQCHASAKYDSTAHHLHVPGSAGAQCAACHMPARTYMQVDPRRDHSMRVPRPDLSVQYGVPNACNGCHRDRDAAWAAAAIERAHGPKRKGYQHYAGTLAAARAGAPGTLPLLLQLAGVAGSPGIARATAVAALGRYPGVHTLEALDQAAADADPLLRAAAMDALLAFPSRLRAPLALSLAQDPLADVRIKAGRALAAVPDAELSPPQQVQREQLFEQYRAAAVAVAERPESHVDLGSVYAERGEAAAAESEYRAALRLDPGFVPAYVNLADLQRTQSNEEQTAATLAEGLRQVPENPTLLHLSGLQRVRAGDHSGALELLRRAAQAAPGNPHFAYVYAVALHSAGQTEPAMVQIEQALRRSPYSPELLSGAAAFEREAGHAQQAAAYAARYEAVAPER
jgi:predicted CXXCH cytochrome family protein